MSMLLMVRAMHLKIGNPIRKLILLKLADNANDQGECWPSYQHIADLCEVDKRTAQRHVKALCEEGYLKKESRMREYGNTSNMYILSLGDGTESLGGRQKVTPGAAQSHPKSVNESVNESNTSIQQAEHEPVEIQLDIEDQIDRAEKQEYPHKLTLDQLKQISLHWENSMSGISPLVDLTKKTQVNKKRWAKINKVLKDHPEYWDHEYFAGYFDRLATMQEFEWQRSNNQLSFDQALQLDKFERNRDVMLLAENKR